ncbi:uncharacterized protein LOC141773121 [Sebastes fasciatus]|uniref:uncharacterized protein LOC141773121 n=1 Tax=Sebastes fasciatus TaxID=394691 RepID=UPI003D9F6A73
MPFNHQSLNMKVCHTLICCFFLSLQDGNNSLVNAQTTVYTGTEGEDVRVKCSSSLSGIRNGFCKEQCKQKDILIVTSDVRAQRGRYSIEWNKKQGTILGDVSVTITQLIKSDSGRYRCGRSFSTFEQIEIIVVDARLDEDTSGEKTLYKRTGENIMVACYFTSFESRKYFCKEDCREKDLVETSGSRGQTGRYSIRYVEGTPSGGFVYVGITQLTKSDSGRYRCGLDTTFFRDPYLEFEIIVTDAPTTSKPNLTLPAFSSSASTATISSSGNSTLSASPKTTEQPETVTTKVLLYLGLTLVIMVVSSLSVLIYCRKRTSKPKDPTVETQYAYVTETNQVYENIRDDGQSRTPPVEISSVNAYAQYAETNEAETNDDYSITTAAGSQNTAEDDSSRLTYSQVNFSNRAAGSSNSTLRGDGDNVVYSVPRVHASSDVSHAEADLPVYSTVNRGLQE